MKLVLFILLCAVSYAVGQEVKSGYDEKEVQFANGTINLTGSLLFPKGEGPFPAAVIVHGSGESDRSNPWTAAYAKSLAQRGIAVLYPDKRGSGKSQGDWRTAGFTDLADDAVAGVELLFKDARIDKSRIGVIGFSQGGHIVPLAAARSSHISFVIDVSGSTVPIFEQIADEIVLGAERAGLSEKQINILTDINAKGLRYALTGNGWNEYQSALNAAKSGELKGQKIIEGFPDKPDHWTAAFIRAIGDFDPMPYWEKLSVPVLFIYGGQDTQIRIAKSINRIKEKLSPNKRNYTVMLFNNNGHGLHREDLLTFVAQWIIDKGAG